MNIGDIVQGGVLFYSGATILIASLKDIEIPLYWDNFKNAVSGTSTAIGSGATNTTKIVSVCTGNTMIAASVCSDYSFSGYTDWFLPSKDELNQIYLRRSLIGGFDENSNYWSSSQNMPDTAWVQFFLNGLQSELGGKDQLYKVRPIRIMT